MAPILVMSDSKEPFYLEADASAYTSGAVLMQKDENGHLHLYGYLSHTFNSMEQCYQIYNRELFTLIRALNKW